jgi:hypothetical protein
MHAMCAAAFPGSHLCHVSEYLRTNSATTVPASGAWIEPSANSSGNMSSAGLPQNGRYSAGYNCDTWTTASSGYTSIWLTPSGDLNSGSGPAMATSCAASRPLACCI